MRTLLIHCAAAWMLALGACAPCLAEEADAPKADAPKADAPGADVPGADVPKAVTLDASQQTRMGVVVSALGAAQPSGGTATIARVLDPGPLLALDSELGAALASWNASHAEAERTRKLFGEDRTASARALEAAASQAQADLQRVESARRRILLEWGDGVADLAAARRSALLNEVARVHAELIRVELPVGVSAPKSGTTLDVQVNLDGPNIPTVVLGTMPAADPRLQTRGVLVELKGDLANLAIGRMLTARIPASAEPGHAVLIPRGALVRKASRVWVYVQTAPTTFIRREVSGYQPMSDGWIVHSGFGTGDRVVSGGAAALLAVEVPAAAAD